MRINKRRIYPFHIYYEQCQSHSVKQGDEYISYSHFVNSVLSIQLFVCPIVDYSNNVEWDLIKEYNFAISLIIILENTDT